MQQSSATLKNRDVGLGLQKIVAACSQSSSQCLLVSTVFGMVSSLHPTSFLMIFILVLQIFYVGLAFDTIIYSARRLRRDDITRTYAHAYCARQSCPPLGPSARAFRSCDVRGIIMRNDKMALYYTEIAAKTWISLSKGT